jgi:hypothetical protein
MSCAARRHASARIGNRALSARRRAFPWVVRSPTSRSSAPDRPAAVFRRSPRRNQHALESVAQRAIF